MNHHTDIAIEAIYSTYARAWIDRDPDAIARLHTPDTQFWLHSGEQPVVGRDNARDYFAGLFDSYPNFGVVEYRTMFGDWHWILDWAMTSTVTDEDTTRTVRWDCLDIVTIDDRGLVTRKDTYLDLPQATAQLEGAPS